MTKQEHAQKFPLSYTAFRLDQAKERLLTGSEGIEDLEAYAASDYLRWFLEKSGIEQKLAIAIEALEKIADYGFDRGNMDMKSIHLIASEAHEKIKQELSGEIYD